MTDLVPAGTTPAVISDVDGLEDFGIADLVTPLLRIDHHKGVFVNSLTKEEYSEINGVILGLVRQRVLWPPDIAENSSDPPLCRSYDYVTGYPNQKEFPVAESGFSTVSSTLPCNSCRLQQWGTHPKREAPWCSEQHTFPILMQVQDSTEPIPIIFSIQRSGLKESKAYCSYFKNAKQPLYSVWTTLSLEGHKRGTNPYHIPKFQRGPATEISSHPQFSSAYRVLRQFLHTPWTGETNDDDSSLDADETPVATSAPTASSGSPLGKSAPAPAPAPAPTPTPTPTPTSDPDDLPF